MGIGNLEPKLRFPQFTGEWEKRKLEDVAEKIQDGTHFSPQSFEKGDYLYITSKNVKNGYMDLASAQYVLKEDHKNIYKRCDVKKGDVLLTKDGTIGQVCVNELEEEFSILSSVAYIRPNRFNSNYFIYQVLVSPIGQKEIESQIAGQALKRITLTKINNFEYFFPTLNEQLKVADFLNKIDGKLALLKKKKSLLEKYKKGVMQQFFSQELRFKDDDGNDFPDWEEKKIEDFAPLQRGFDLPVDNIINGEFPVVFSNGILKFHSEYKVNAPGVVTGRSGTIGKVSYVEKDFWPHNTSLWVTDFKGNNPKFVYFFYSKYQLERFGTGSGVPTLNRNNVHSQIEQFPTPPEQHKIASFLSALDDKIAQTALQIEKMQLWKKGLLQQLFV